jgi:hypothetical protein
MQPRSRSYHSARSGPALDDSQDEYCIIKYVLNLEKNIKEIKCIFSLLAQDNFTKVAKTKELMLTMFYAPWCKHCKQLGKFSTFLKSHLDYIVSK